jgi:hypothetical protein
MVKRIIMKTTLFILIAALAVLAVHIYVVTRPHVDADTRVMARIDIHQPLTREQADGLTGWLYRQQGVDHVLCNAATSIVVFTYAPLRANADEIAGRFNTALNFPHAVRYVPTEKELRGSCPFRSHF